MPVKAHQGRVVFELASGSFENRVDEVLHRLAGVHRRAFGDQRLEIEAGGTSLQGSSVLPRDARFRRAGSTVGWVSRSTRLAPPAHRTLGGAANS